MPGTQYFFQILPPVVPLIFAVVLAAIWRAQRKPYIGLFALAFTGLSAGLAMQILRLPPDGLLNAVTSNLAYTLSVTAFVCGLLHRAERPMNPWLLATIILAVNLLIVYFAYVDRNLGARMYTQNFGFGALLVLAALHLRGRRDLLIDRVLFWSVLVLGTSFFVRTFLTASTGASQTTASGFGRSLFWISLNFSLVLFAIILGLVLLVAIAVDIIEDVRIDGSTDQLTQLLNRRGFEGRAAAAFAAARQPVSLVICDIDHFKQVNDTYGHMAGDRVLAEFARRLREEARTGDAVGRYGGEEFVILLPGADKAEAHKVAERIRAAIAAHVFRDIAPDLQVTASFGVAERRAGETLDNLVRRADRRLYAAKRGGRNTIITRETGAGASVP